MSDVTAKSIARLAYGYELMFQQLCHIAGTSGGSPHWFTEKGQEIIARVDPLWKLTEGSNSHKPGDCLSQHVPFAEWAAQVELKADALEHWRQEAGKLHSQIAAKDAEIARLREALDECEDYFDNRADADCDQDGYIPNEEMKLLHVVRTALERLPAPSSTTGEAA